VQTADGFFVNAHANLLLVVEDEDARAFEVAV
jgi:hypothetical protein